MFFMRSILGVRVDMSRPMLIDTQQTEGTRDMCPTDLAPVVSLCSPAAVHGRRRRMTGKTRQVGKSKSQTGARKKEKSRKSQKSPKTWKSATKSIKSKSLEESHDKSKSAKKNKKSRSRKIPKSGKRPESRKVPSKNEKDEQVPKRRKVKLFVVLAIRFLFNPLCVAISRPVVSLAVVRLKATKIQSLFADVLEQTEGQLDDKEAASEPYCEPDRLCSRCVWRSMVLLAWL